MTVRTLIFDRTLADDVTLFAHDYVNQNGWIAGRGSLYDGSYFWDALQATSITDLNGNTVAGICAASTGSPAGSFLYRTLPSQISTATTIEIEVDYFVEWGADSSVAFNPVDDIIFEIFNSARTKYITNFARSLLGNMDIPQTNLIFKTQLADSSTSFAYENTVIKPNGLANGLVTTFKTKHVVGKKTVYSLSPDATGFFVNIPNSATAVLTDQSSNYDEFALYVRGTSQSQRIVLVAVRLYTVDETAVGPQVPNIVGLVDPEGNQIIGVDPSDNGSGSNTGGTGGYGGGGLSDGTDSVVGGRYINGTTGAIGRVGSGAEGNVDYTGFTASIGTGDSSAWAGSGSGINISSWNFTQEMDGFGFAEIVLTVVNGWSSLLNSFKGQTFILNNNGTVLFRGYVSEVQTQGRYKALLTIKEVQTYLTENETLYNYATVINSLGYAYDTISNVSGTTITLTNGDTSAIATDNTMGVMIIPGSEPASSNEDFDTIVTGIAPSGDATNVNTKNDLYISQNTNIIEMSGIYSGTRASITTLVFTADIKIEADFYDSVIGFYLYNYQTSAYVLIKSQTVAGALFMADFFLLDITFQEYDLTITSNPTYYIGDGAGAGTLNEFKIKIAYVSGTPSNRLRLYFCDLTAYTDPFYDGSYFPITAKPAADQITSSTNFATAGVNTGDTVVVGLRNDLVIAQLAAEWLPETTIDVDADSFTGYTASDFYAQHSTNYDALVSVLRREQGIMYYAADVNTLYFKKKSNLVSTFITFSNSTFMGGLPALITNAQNKQADYYRNIAVTGNSFKVYDNDKAVYQEIRVSGPLRNRTLRINDPAINSWTEAKERAEGELALMRDAESAPVFTVKFNITDQVPTLQVGKLYGVIYYSTKYSADTNKELPLRMINISKFGTSPLQVSMEFGWHGTSYEDRAIDELNDIRKRLRLLEKGLNLRPAGTLGSVQTAPSYPVTSVFTRTGAVVAASNDYTWAQINKATSDIADITTKSHTSLTSIGSLTHATIDSYLDQAVKTASTPTFASLGTISTEIPALYLSEGAGTGAYFGLAQEFQWNYNGSHFFLNGTTGKNVYFKTFNYLVLDNQIFDIRDPDDSFIELLLFNTSARTFTIGAAADLIATSHYGKFTLVTASDTDNIAAVNNYASGAYGAAWATVALPSSPVNGMTVIRYNSDSTSSRLYIYSNAGWHYVDLT